MRKLFAQMGKVLFAASFIWSIVIAWHVGVIATICTVLLSPFAQIYWAFKCDLTSGFGMLTLSSIALMILSWLFKKR